MTVQILKGDCREVLRTLPDESVHCVVTSPPYFGLRDYGVEGQIGQEPEPAAFVAELVSVFRDVRRVLRKDGTVWLNLGDTYASAWPCSRRNVVGEGSLPNGKREARPPRMGGDLKEKDLIGVPWLVAFALRADGWYLRQDIIWSKPNPMPESVRDRCTKAHEYLFLLSKSQRYYFDSDAIAEPCLAGDNGSSFVSEYDKATKPNLGQGERKQRRAAGNVYTAQAFIGRPQSEPRGPNKNFGEFETRNKRSVWDVATAPFGEAHFATFPPALIEPCIKAGCPQGGTVLDPFGGAGTTGLVADRLGRNAILIELNPEYAEMAERRIKADAGLFADVG